MKNIDDKTVASFSDEWSCDVAPKVGRLHCIDPSDAIEVVPFWYVVGVKH
jgi:hypothetical protein